MKRINIFLFLTMLMCMVGVFTMTALTSCGDDDATGNSISQSTGIHNGHQWVDLGLSVKWATCNIGASQPYEFGNYFAWGETTGYNEGKRDFSKETYKWYEEGVGYTKYCNDTEKGIVDNKYLLDAEDDAATVNWGANWRIPHPNEVAELMNGCYWEWTNNYNVSGVKGCIVYKAKTTTDKGIYCDAYRSVKPSAKYDLNDTHIFLPAAGSYNTTYYEAGGGNKEGGGLYLTSALGHDDGPGQTEKTKTNTYYYINNYTGSLIQYGFDYDERAIGDSGPWHGYSVRAVCPF